MNDTTRRPRLASFWQLEQNLAETINKTNRSGILSREKWARVSMSWVSWSSPRLPPCLPCISKAVLLLANGQPKIISPKCNSLLIRKRAYPRPECSIYFRPWRIITWLMIKDQLRQKMPSWKREKMKDFVPVVLRYVVYISFNLDTIHGWCTARLKIEPRLGHSNMITLIGALSSTSKDL